MEDETLDYSKGYKKTKFYQTMNGEWYFQTGNFELK